VSVVRPRYTGCDESATIATCSKKLFQLPCAIFSLFQSKSPSLVKTCSSSLYLGHVTIFRWVIGLDSDKMGDETTNLPEPRASPRPAKGLLLDLTLKDPYSTCKRLNIPPPLVAPKTTSSRLPSWLRLSLLKKIWTTWPQFCWQCVLRCWQFSVLHGCKLPRMLPTSC
jgi:hypothetical protein